MDEARDRFFSYVNKTETCWLWTGYKERAGYGVFQLQTTNPQKAHRVSWFLAGNTIPNDKLILRHKCRNKHCVNPEHLETGTYADNMRDKVRDGTDIKGEQCAKAKLTENQIIAIRTNTENKLQKELAIQYGVTLGTISKIILRRTWKHL